MYKHLVPNFNIFANISNGSNLPNLNSLLIIANFESIIGIFINLVCLDRFLSMLPHFKSQSE